jgi:stage III sporulation protein AE
MRRFLVIMILILTFYPNMYYTSYSLNIENEPAKIEDEIIMKQLKNIDMEEFGKIIQSINQDTENYLPKLDIRKIVHSLIKGEEIFSFKDMINGIFRYLFKEIIANSNLLVKIIVLSIICAFLNNLSSAFESDAVAKLAYVVCYLVIIAIAIKSFSIATAIGIDAINDMVMFMQVLLPILLTFLMAMGGITTTAVFQPIIIGSVGIISTLIKNIIMPIIFFSAVLSIVNHLSSKIQISRLASLLKQIAIILLGFILTIFTGIITIQGFTSSTTDGVTAKTAKFAVEKFIPIVGGFISDALDTIVGCSLLLKNAIGAIGLISLALIVIMPLLKILSLILVYKISTALIEPIIESPLIHCLNDMSNAIILLFVTVLSVAVMFFMAVTIIVGAGNMTLMMR